MPPHDYERGDPCPNCGSSGSFGATVKSHGTLYFDDEGRVTDWKERHAGETLQIQCLDCDMMLMDKLNEPPDHSFEVGEYALDRREPTPSPEANTVKVVELLDERANECFIEETGKHVSEHKHNRFYPETDPVVVGVYPNMGSDKEWHFPESRLQKV